jgi:hypothetical protein
VRGATGGAAPLRNNFVGENGRGQQQQQQQQSPGRVKLPSVATPKQPHCCTLLAAGCLLAAC